MATAQTTNAVSRVSINGVVQGQMVDPLAKPGNYKVNVPKTMERISQPLYSYVSYPAGGASSFTFFQSPVGQGGATILDTNMVLAGQIPSPQMFLIQGIGVVYKPGLTAAAPVLGPRADAATGALNDMYAILKFGVLQFNVGSKQYFQAPLLDLPPRSHYDGFGALSSQTTPAAALQTVIQIPYVSGDVYKPIPLLLESGQNFNCQIIYPNGAQSIPSGDALAFIGVELYGTLYRPAQ